MSNKYFMLNRLYTMLQCILIAFVITTGYIALTPMPAETGLAYNACLEKKIVSKCTKTTAKTKKHITDPFAYCQEEAADLAFLYEVENVPQACIGIKV